MKATQTQIAASLRKHHGAVAAVARELGMDRSSIHERIGRSEKLQQVVANIEARADQLGRDTLADAHRVIRAKLAEDDATTARWYAERRDPDFRTAPTRLDPDSIAAAMAFINGGTLRTFTGD